MGFKYRSVTFRCEDCGKCHSYYGQDADDIMQMTHAVLTNFFSKKKLLMVNMVKPDFTCCDIKNKDVRWDVPSVFENEVRS